MEVIVSLIVIALVLFFLEIFLPGGILGGFAILLLLGSVVLAYFEFGWQGALLTFGISCLLAITAFVIEITMLRKLPFARKLFLDTRQPGTRSSPESEALIGQTGEVVTTMAPTGTVRIGDREFEAASRSGMLTRGMTVRVVARDSFRLIVETVG